MDLLATFWEYAQTAAAQAGNPVQFQDNVLTFGLRLILAVVVVLAGRWLARRVRFMLRRALRSTELSLSMINLFVAVAYYGIIILAIAAALIVAGVPLDSVILVVGVVLVIVAIALQESLGNLAAAVIFLLFQPFKAGDMIEAAGVFGTVQEIQMFRTLFLTRGNTAVSVPNSAILNSNIVNYTQEGIVRLDMRFTISYSDDLRQAKRILEQIITGHDYVLADPPPVVGVDELGDNGVIFVFRPFVAAGDMWQTRYDLNEQVKLAFDEAGITIPFPQRDVHMYQSDA